MQLNPCKSVNGDIIVPGDKSISHRAIMFGSLAKGQTYIKNFLISEDTLSTINCFRQMGVDISIANNSLLIKGKGLFSLMCPYDTLHAENSGTTARLLSGILAGQGFTSSIDGDDSLRKRPMNRIAIPLSKMGCDVSTSSGFLPITIRGGKLAGIDYHSDIPSAQVKSCIILAALYASTKSIYHEPYPSRNHTELMLGYFGGSVEECEKSIVISPVECLNARELYVPGDISSAAYFIVLSLICRKSCIVIRDVGLNDTRIGIIEVLKSMGGQIAIENVRMLNNEPFGDIIMSSSELHGVNISGQIIPRLIDELPLIAVAAVFAKGITTIKDAQELKFKESDRLKTISSELKKMGAKIEKTNDGLIIQGTSMLKGTKVSSHGDHRIAMALSIAAKIAFGSTFIENSYCVNISFPGFYKILEFICNN